MMNAHTPSVTPKLDNFVQQVLPPAKADELWRSLPSHIKPAVFERNLLNALMQNPDLINYAPALVYREVSKAAGLGLLLDPQLGEAYMVVAYNYKTRQQEPQLRVGYKGVIKLARQAGNVEAIYAHEVCQNDKIVCHMGTDKKLVHEPVLFSERGKVIGYYAVIKYKDGAFDFEPMSVQQVHAIRDRSDAWKAFSEGKIKSTPWSTDEDEMSKKTVLRRLLKRQPQSGELSTAISIEDEAEFPEFRTVSPARILNDAPPPPPPPPPPAIENKRPAEVVPLRTVVETPQVATAEDVFDAAGWLRDLEGAASGCTSIEELTEVTNKIQTPGMERATAPDRKRATQIMVAAFSRICDDEEQPEQAVG
jgi:phage RecT family recombinase